MFPAPQAARDLPSANASPSRPRVGFDVSPLARPHSPGLTHLVDALVGTLEQRGVLDVVRLSPGPGQNPRAWRQRELPRAVREQALLGLHSFVSAFAWPGAGHRVQTVHELPWRHGVRENADLRHRGWARFGSWRAAHVVCASEHVAIQLREQALFRAEKLRVIPWGVGAPFAPRPAAGEFDELLLGKYRLGEDPLLLAPGAVRAKKGLDRLLRGLAQWRQGRAARIQLVVTGAHTSELRRDLGLASQLGLAGMISTPGEIDAADMPGLYRLATVVGVLSRSEGFSFPVLQAMASGTPALVPRGSAQAELAGSTGFEVEADDAQSVAQGIEQALAQRALRRAALLERAGKFSWDESARRVEALWAELS